MNKQDTDVLILGAGLTGLAAASVLGENAVVLERESRPGGLVRTENFNGYWFDIVIHILHFTDNAIEARIRNLLKDDLKSCPPEAWVETAFGTVRYPFQMHLRGLEVNQIVRCLRDLEEVTFSETKKTPSNFEEMLLQTFGKAMCETFLFPYNRKLWKRPLDTLAPTGFQWTITPPDFLKVLQGATNSNYDFRAYNANGWYPQPPKNAVIRGMEFLSSAIAKKVFDLRLNHTIKEIDLEKRKVTAHYNNQVLDFVFRKGCCVTLPLPKVIRMCKQAPQPLLKQLSSLTYNRVLSATFSIRGPRPVDRGHWRYYSDESLIFTRLVYMHEFDPDSAPEDGWGLLVEITEPAESPLMDKQTILSRIREDIKRVGALEKDCEVVDEQLIVIDPAYVVFTIENQPIIEQARDFLKTFGVEPIGRYGKWEYSSMSQVLRDGSLWGEKMATQIMKQKAEKDLTLNRAFKSINSSDIEFTVQ